MTVIQRERAEMKSKVLAGYIEAFDIDAIVPSPFQNRVFPGGWEQNPEMVELAQNIKAIGIAQPLVARPHPSKAGVLELVAGERRLRASKLAGLKTVPVMVRELTDSEAADITISENLQRKDLSVFETSQGIQTLIEVTKNDVEAIAAHYGKSPRWVYLMAGIGKLTECWKEQAAPGGELDRWTAAHWALIARFSEDEQQELYEQCRLSDDLSVAELDREITQHFMQIKQAPWAADDDTLLPEAGACSACGKRTDLQCGLFDDEGASEEDIKQNARCMDSGCWKRKSSAFRGIAIAENQKKYPGMVYCLLEHIGYREREELKEEYKPFYEKYDFKKATKSEKGAVPAFVLAGKGAGKVCWIMPHTTKNSAPARPVNPETGKPEEPTAQERMEKLQNRRRAWVVDRMVAMILKSGDGEIVPTHEIICRYACVFSSRPFSEQRYEWRHLKKGDGFPEKNTDRCLWRALHDDLLSTLKFNRHLAYDEAAVLARDCEIDLRALDKQAEEEIKPSKALLKQMQEDAGK